MSFGLNTELERDGGVWPYQSMAGAMCILFYDFMNKFERSCREMGMGYGRWNEWIHGLRSGY